MYYYVSLCIAIYYYVSVCTAMYQYVLVFITMYQYVLLYNIYTAKIQSIYTQLQTTFKNIQTLSASILNFRDQFRVFI